MAFPTTSVIDDFTRGDNPTALGGNWSTPIETGDGSFGILSNQAYPSTGAWLSNFWTSGFGADQESYVDIAALPSGQFQLWARLQGVPAASYSGYKIHVWNDGTLDLIQWVSGTPSTIDSTGSGTIVSGDSVGLECIGDSIKGYLKHSGSWSEVLSATDSGVTGAGYIGIKIPSGTESTLRLDNFGGGEYVSTAAPTIRTVRSSQRW